MRITSRLLVLGTVLILLSGSLVSTRQSSAISSPEWQLEVQSLLAKQEEDLANYKKELQKSGEDIYAQRQGELRRAQAQELHNAVKELQTQMLQDSRELQEELTAELLRQQLQLVLVTLDATQKETRLDTITQIQNQMKSIQDDMQASYEEQLQQLHAEHEQSAQEAAVALQATVERFLAEEFASYEMALVRELEAELMKMRSKQSTNLRSGMAIR